MAVAGQPASAESTNWLESGDQQYWFDRFAVSCDHQSSSSSSTSSLAPSSTAITSTESAKTQLAALRFQQFHLFLRSTIYEYFDKFPSLTNGNDGPASQAQAMNPPCTNGRAADNLNQHNNPSNEFTKQQEMHLFKKFDLNNDHLIDLHEFVQLCRAWLHPVFSPSCGLVVVDVQNDFIDGSLALINGPARQDGAEVIPAVNVLVDAFQAHKATIVYTLDWHPQDHVSFHANLHLRKHTLKKTTDTTSNRSDIKHDDNNNSAKMVEHESMAGQKSTSSCNQQEQFKYKRLVPKAKLFDTVLFADGHVEQKLWPIHCISNSWGAQLHPKLKIAPDAIRIQKGTLPDVDSYSAFWDNMRANETGLRQELAQKRVTDLFFCGLATDYCVAASAMDSIKAGFVTFVVDDACRGIDLDEIDKQRRELQEHGAFIVNSQLALEYLSRCGGSSRGGSKNGSSKHCFNRSLIKIITYRKALF